MEKPDNIITFKPRPKIEGSDLHMTGVHLISALREEFEKQKLMTQGLSFSFDMLLYGLNKKERE